MVLSGGFNIREPLSRFKLLHQVALWLGHASATLHPLVCLFNGSLGPLLPLEAFFQPAIVLIIEEVAGIVEAEASAVAGVEHAFSLSFKEQLILFSLSLEGSLLYPQVHLVMVGHLMVPMEIPFKIFPRRSWDYPKILFARPKEESINPCLENGVLIGTCRIWSSASFLFKLTGVGKPEDSVHWSNDVIIYGQAHIKLHPVLHMIVDSHSAQRHTDLVGNHITESLLQVQC